MIQVKRVAHAGQCQSCGRDAEFVVRFSPTATALLCDVCGIGFSQSFANHHSAGYKIEPMLEEVGALWEARARVVNTVDRLVQEARQPESPFPPIVLERLLAPVMALRAAYGHLIDGRARQSDG